MAFLEIKTWKLPDGSTKTAQNYTVHTTYDSRRYRIPGWDVSAVGKKNSEELGRNIDRLLMGKASGDIRPELRKYLETLPDWIRRSLAAQGIIDQAAEGRPIADHLAASRTALEGKGVTVGHVTATAGMIEAAATACRFKMMG